jgi:GxxExxY protein
VCVSIFYKGEELTTQRLDMVVDERLVVETKATLELHSAAARQVHNYLRATNLELALLFHFGPKPKFFRLISSNEKRPEAVHKNSRLMARGGSIR